MSQSLYKKAIALWGVSFQMDMAIEEASELIKAICKIKRQGASRETIAALVDEMADVEIMLEQLKIMLSCERGVAARKVYKLERLEEMLGGNECG